jgi:hypothetical protein
VKRLLLFLCLVSAAIYMLALPRAVPEGEEEIAIAQGGDDSKQRPHGPLHSSWGSTLQSLRQKPDASAPSQETARFRQAGAYRKGPDPGQADPEQIIGTNDLTGSVDEASAAATGDSLNAVSGGWGSACLGATKHDERGRLVQRGKTATASSSVASVKDVMQP